MENLLEHARSILVTSAPPWRALVDYVDEALLKRAPGELQAAERDAFPVRVPYFLAEQDFPRIRSRRGRSPWRTYFIDHLAEPATKSTGGGRRLVPHTYGLPLLA
jgi:hypothetical protein